jgi:hypothetical protein
MEKTRSMCAIVPFDSSRRNFLGGIAGTMAASSLPLAALGWAGQNPSIAQPGPSRDQVAGMLKPLLRCSDPAIWQLVIDAYTDCVLGKIRRPDPPLAYSWIVPGGGYYAQWLWDTMFVLDLLSILPGQQETSRGVFQNYWDFQQRWNREKPVLMHGMADLSGVFAGPITRLGYGTGIQTQSRHRTSSCRRAPAGRFP